jgi:hypothetical protein
VVALIAAGSAACGTAQATPQGKVQNAFTKLGEQKSVTLGLSFAATPEQIYAVMKAKDFGIDDARVLASLHATVSVSSDKPLAQLDGNDKNSSSGVSLSSDRTGPSSLAEIRVVHQKVYLRADLKSLQKLDTSKSAAADFGDLNSLVDDADRLPSSLNSVKAALKGQWVVIDPKAFGDFAKSMAGKSGDSGNGSGAGKPLAGGSPEIDAKTERRLVNALKQAFAHNATYKDLGTRDGADHVQVGVPARQLVKDFSTSLPSILRQVPGVKASDLKGLNDLSGVPDRTVTADVAIKGGSVSGITFDLAQLDDKTAGGKLPLALTLDDSAGPVSAPQGAQQLNPQDIVGLFMADMPGLSDSFSKSSASSDLSGLN